MFVNSTLFISYSVLTLNSPNGPHPLSPLLKSMTLSGFVGDYKQTINQATKLDNYLFPRSKICLQPWGGGGGGREV